MTSSDPEKISFISSEVFLLFIREKNNLVLPKDGVCVRMRTVHTCLHRYPSTGVCGPSSHFPVGPVCGHPQSSKGKNWQGWERRGWGGLCPQQVAIFSFLLPLLIHAAPGASQDLRGSLLSLMGQQGFPAAVGFPELTWVPKGHFCTLPQTHRDDFHWKLTEQAQWVKIPIYTLADSYAPTYP